MVGQTRTTTIWNRNLIHFKIMEDKNMTIAEKYPNLKNKTIKEMVLEIVEECAQKCKEGHGLNICCGWWEGESQPRRENSEWFDLMAGECYHEEINKIMEEQGFHIYEDLGRFHYRARTYYRL